MRILFIFWLSMSAALAGVIPADRSIPWIPGQTVGVPGGIPDRTNIFVNVLSTTNTLYQCFGDGIHDETTSISNAIRNCPSNQVVYLPAGNYLLTHTLQFNNKKNFSLRGDGMGQTILTFTNASLYFVSGQFTPPTNQTAAWVSGFIKGSTNITLDSSPVSLAVGNLLLLDQLNDGLIVSSDGGPGGGHVNFADRLHNGTRNLAQLVRVTAVSNGTNVTVWPPLNTDFNADLTPQATTVPSFLTGIGMEDFSVTNLTGGDRDTFELFSAYGCWFKNVEISRVGSHALLTSYLLQCEIRDCYFHEGFTYTVGAGYGVTSINSYNCLYQNNIFYHLYDSYTLDSSSGNVSGYNYVTYTFSSPTNYMIAGISANHASHSCMNLYEGNVVNEIQADFTWGSSGHITLFRNNLTGDDIGINSNRKAVSLDSHSLSNCVVGNVLGNANITWSTYIQDSNSFDEADPTIIRLGYPSIGNNSFDVATNVPGSTDLDTRVSPSTLITGNFDYFHNDTVWNSDGEQSLPDSLYLTEKPSWWGDTAWPPIGSDLSPMTSEIPAQTRFASLTQQQEESPPVVTGGSVYMRLRRR